MHLSGFVVMFQEEQEYVELVAAEKHQQEAVKSALAQNKTLSMLDEILEDVRKAADRLEEEIEEHAFDNNKQVSKHLQSLNMISLHLWHFTRFIYFRWSAFMQHTSK